MTEQTFNGALSFNALSEAQIPEAVQNLAADAVTKVRAVYDTAHTAAKSGGKTLETFLDSAGSGARAVSSKVLDNIAANTESMLEAAEAVARAETFPQAAQLQVEFMQEQFLRVGEQTRELLNLYAKVAANTFDSLQPPTIARRRS